MSAEVVAATAAGVGLAGIAAAYDQNLAMASVGGACFMLAVSVTIPIQVRFFFFIGSLVLGYVVGTALGAASGWTAWSALTAFATSALGSSLFGSLHGWFSGGVQPAWLTFLIKLLPFSLKKGGDRPND